MRQGYAGPGRGATELYGRIITLDIGGGSTGWLSRVVIGGGGGVEREREREKRDR